jgi:hypothetical protein
VWDAVRQRGLLLNGDARATEPRRSPGTKAKVVDRYVYTDAGGWTCSLRVEG